MGWKPSLSAFSFQPFGQRSGIDTVLINEQCFIRKEHRCGKIYGASKSCFIACPTDDELEPVLELISEKLTKVGIEPIIAVKERAYGQDIFCTKICGKIIESRFCLVILDDNVKGKTNIPNPNVYYEYGLMTSLRKHIIPLQKNGLQLAFNIQSYDTIKYGPKNIGAELDRAVKDATRLTDRKKETAIKVALPEKTILRRLELAGLNLRDERWFLSAVVDDTNFKGFSHATKAFSLFLAKVDAEEEFQDYHDDLRIVIHRTEQVANSLYESLRLKLKHSEVFEAAKYKQDTFAPLNTFSGPSAVTIIDSGKKERLDSEIADLQRRLMQMKTIFVGFIVSPDIKTKEYESKLQKIVKGYERYKVSISSKGVIEFGDVSVTLSESED